MRTSYWRRLDDLEYLQGFADRAYHRLVDSGRYGYRSLARLLEETIEQQYPLRIDPNWVAFRSQTERRWAPLEHSAETERQARLLHCEKPTDFRSDYQSSTSAKPAAPVSWVSGLVRRYPIARRGWHLIPQSHRGAILRVLGL